MVYNSYEVRGKSFLVLNATMSLKDKEGYYLPVDFEEWTENLNLKAQIELNETEKKVREGLHELKALIKENEVPCCTDDAFLILFLRAKKFKIKKCFEQLSSYSYQRHAMMNYYGFMFANKIMPAVYNNICGVLPKRDHEGRVVMFFLASNFSPEICDPDDVLRAVQSIGHFILTFPATQVCGMALIADLKVESLQTLHLLFKYVKFILPTMHAFPARIKKVDCINVNPIVRALLAIIQPLIPSKIFKRTSFHSSDEKALLDIYDASILPEEFGGTMGSIKDFSQTYIQKLEQYIPRLQATNHYFKRKGTIPFPE